MKEIKKAVIDGITVEIDNERNLLELIRKANIELPTFCYHSDISVYGACRMCMVEVEGMGLVTACSTPVRDGMKVKTQTKQIRDMRKMIIELLLASHDQSCTTCPKTEDCKLQTMAKRLGVSKVRFDQSPMEKNLDLSSPSIVRDPAKCILCGDCVRVCNEKQSVGVLDFTGRGSDSKVETCFNRPLGKVECVNCGQCVKVCPVGALTIRYNIKDAWNAIYDDSKKVVVQVAPAVRVAIGEYFGEEPGALTEGKIVSALKMMGFDNVYDTNFSADLTVVEEANEFLDRFSKGENIPQFTSCCPAWVKFAEQYYPDMLPNISTCKSPQQMFGSVAKEVLPKQFGIKREDLVVVSIMPCTAKKYEAKRDEFQVDGNKDVDIVLTTKELALMIKESGIDFKNIEGTAFDMPFGMASGGGVIFGVTGGVSEAVLRYAADKIGGVDAEDVKLVRGMDGIKVAEINAGAAKLKLAVVSGLANARKLIDKVRAGEEHYDLIEVMACCGGCVNGGGQPIVQKNQQAVESRAKGLYQSDKMQSFQNSGDNPYIKNLYAEDLKDGKAHEILHTGYQNRKRIEQEDIVLAEAKNKQLDLKICFGSSCYLRGAQDLYMQIVEYIRTIRKDDVTEITASFCGQECKKGPVVKINGTSLEHCTFDMCKSEIDKVFKI